MFFVPFVLTGFALRALERGSRFYQLRLELELPWALAAGLALRAAAQASFDGEVARSLLVAALSFILIPLLHTAHLSGNAGLWLLALGGLLQLAVVIANGGRMPVWAAQPAHPLYLPAAGARLPALGDTLRLPGPGSFFSPGDLLIGFGLTATIALAPPRRSLDAAVSDREDPQR